MVNERWNSLVYTLIATAMLTACSTRVHLYTEGMDATEIDRVRNVLLALDYEVALNARPVPASVTTPMLVHARSQRSLGRIQALESLLQEHGYELLLVSESVGNNYYTPGNVGLYLHAYPEVARTRQPPTHQRTANKMLAGKEFAGECPDIDAVLNLEPDNDFTVELIEWNDTTRTESGEKRSGRWLEAGGGHIVVLGLGDQQIAFSREDFTEQYRARNGIREKTVVTEVIRLVNSSDALRGCNFVYRQRL